MNGLSPDIDEPEKNMTEIPLSTLGREVLYELVKEIVTRDGTDYGAVELTTEQKITQALSALENGKARIVWNHETNTASLEDGRANASDSG